MQPVREAMLRAARKGKHLDPKFQVVESSNELLLLAEACTQFELLKVDIDPDESMHVLKSSNLTKDQIPTDYKLKMIFERFRPYWWYNHHHRPQC